ncbi:MAG: FHA domain-containing protein [Leptolyngbyaceae cyanobacterium SM1_4_3]|nr:FHA domain-containing protein [Leptolyngbyaceae cyanobacterium SM1_4_3]
MKLYEHHRELLDEILNLENSRGSSLPGMMFPYVQGMVLNRQVYLITNLRDGNTQMLSQPENTWIIGRDSRQVTLPIADKRLSRCHAAIQHIENHGFFLTDLNSSNGSYVNGEKVQRSLLKDGDRIRLGSLTLVFLAGSESQSMGRLSPEMTERLRQQAELLPPDDPCRYCTEFPGASGSAATRLPVAALEETLTFMRDKFPM